jgi:hypothetical protein
LWGKITIVFFRFFNIILSPIKKTTAKLMKYIEKIIRVIRNCSVISGLNDYRFLRAFCPQLPVVLLVNGKRQHVASFKEEITHLPAPS